MITIDPAAPAAPAPAPPHASHRASGGRGSGWRLAARLARREVRRRPGRTLLVMLLVAVPVMGMTVASVAGRTQVRSDTERFRQEFGAADIAIRHDSDPTSGALVNPPLDALPDGSRTLAVRTTTMPLRGTEAFQQRWVEVSDHPLDDPLTAGIFELVDGRIPAAADEAAISPNVAEEFGAGLGDTLELRQPDRSFRVVGIVQRSSHRSIPVLVAHDFGWQPAHATLGPGQTTLVDLPAGTSDADIVPALWERNLNATSATFENSFGHDEVSGTALAWGWVVGVLLLTVLGIIVAAAFATSARRQLATIGQLSANGASPRLVRRTLALQGTWSGLAGATFGVGVALASLALWGGDTIDRLVRRETGPLAIDGSDLTIIVVTGTIAGTIAALVPARSAARLPVLSALAGRRPLGRVPRWLVPVGVVLFAGGIGLLALATFGARTAADSGSASDNLYAAIAVLGGLGVLFGMCCTTPAIVALLGPAGERLGGTRRLSARSLARLRTRTAGVVSAIAATGAVAVVASTLLLTLDAEDDSLNAGQIAADMVIVQTFSTEAPQLELVQTSVVDQIAAAVPGIEWRELRVAVFDPAPFPSIQSIDVDQSTNEVRFGTVNIGDDAFLDAIELPRRDRDRLAETGALFRHAGHPGPVDVTIAADTGDLVVTAATSAHTSSWSSTELIVTEQIARDLGLEIVTAGLIGRAPRDLTSDQSEALNDIAQGQYTFGYDEPLVSTEPLIQTLIAWRWVDWSLSSSSINLAIVGGVLALTLLVVTIGLSLSATESRDELDVLAAVGAKPGAMAQVAGYKAGFMALAGGVLAIPTGLLPIIAAWESSDTTDIGVVVPWSTIGAVVVAIPAIAALGAWGASATAQRIRPTRMSTLATD